MTTFAKRLEVFDSIMLSETTTHGECIARKNAPDATVGNSGCRCDSAIFDSAIKRVREGA